MPIIEFLTIHLFPSHSFHVGHPAECLPKISAWQAEVSSYPVYFFADKGDSSIIYLISGWHDVDAHMQWMASDRCQELLKIIQAEPFCEVTGMVHLDIDFTAMPNDCDNVVVKKYDEDAVKEESGSVGQHEKVDSLASASVWTGIGKDLEPGSKTVYQISVGCSDKGLDSLELGGEKPSFITMKRLYISSSDDI
jgi:hypothetical protein